LHQPLLVRPGGFIGNIGGVEEAPEQGSRKGQQRDKGRELVSRTSE